MPKLIVRKDGVPDRIIDVDEPVITIGRSKKSTVWLNDNRASRHHCMIVKEGEAYTVVDKGSSNGTFVNCERVTSKRLNPGDAIVVGNHVIFFESIPEDAARHEEFARKEGKDDAAASKEQAAPEYVLEVVEGHGAGDRFPLSDETITIGRNKLNRIVIDDPLVSNYHAEVRKEGEGYFIHDLGSTNGTRVNGEKVVKAPLLPGMELKIGETRLVLKNLGGPGPLEAMRPAGEPTVAVQLERLEKRRTKLFAAFAAILILMGAVLFAAYRLRPAGPEKTPAASSSPTKSPVNLLSANPSFEGAVAGDATPEGWKFEVDPRVNVFVDDTKAATGKKSLAFRNLSASAVTAPNAVVMRSAVPIKGGRSYKLAGMIMTSGVVGFNAVRARVFNSARPSMFLDYYTSPITRTHTSFVPSRCVFTAPGWADRVSVACVSAAEKGDVWFDDITLNEESPIPGFFISLSLPLSPYRFVLDRRGNFWVTDSDRKPVLVSRGLVLHIKGRKSPVLQAFQGNMPVLGGNRRMGKAEADLSLFDISSNSDIPCKVAVNVADGRCSLVFSPMPKARREIVAAELTFAVASSLSEKGLVLASGGTVEEAEAPLKREGVTEVVLGSYDKLLSLAFPAPFSVALSKERGCLAVKLETSPLPGKTFSLATLIGHESPALNEYITESVSKAREMLKAGDMSEALGALKKLLERFPGNPYLTREVERTEAEIAAWTNETETKLDKIFSELKKAADDENADAFSRGMTEVKKLVEEIRIRAGRTPLREKADKVLEEAQTLSRRMERLLHEQKAARLLDMAKRAFAKGKPLLSLVLLENLRKEFKDTEAAALSEELHAKVSKAVAELKKVADEWYELKTRLDDLVKRGSKKAAAREVENFLKRNPGFEPAKKYLETLK